MRDFFSFIIRQVVEHCPEMETCLSMASDTNCSSLHHFQPDAAANKAILDRGTAAKASFHGRKAPSQ
jgi:hypothetical protein